MMISTVVPNARIVNLSPNFAKAKTADMQVAAWSVNGNIQKIYTGARGGQIITSLTQRRKYKTGRYIPTKPVRLWLEIGAVIPISRAKNYKSCSVCPGLPPGP